MQVENNKAHCSILNEDEAYRLKITKPTAQFSMVMKHTGIHVIKVNIFGGSIKVYVTCAFLALSNLCIFGTCLAINLNGHTKNALLYSPKYSKWCLKNVLTDTFTSPTF
jgi:hypothetical protein